LVDKVIIHVAKIYIFISIYLLHLTYADIYFYWFSYN